MRPGTHTLTGPTQSVGDLYCLVSPGLTVAPLSQLSPIRDLGFKLWPFPEPAWPFPSPSDPSGVKFNSEFWVSHQHWSQSQPAQLGSFCRQVTSRSLQQGFQFLGCGGGSPPILDSHSQLTVLPTSNLLPTCSSFPSKRGQGPGKGCLGQLKDRLWTNSF